MIDEIVIASSNRAKIVEISQILSHLPIGILAAAELGSPSSVEETGASYLENARIKARAVVEATGRPALAEDSGLEVDALGGGPGIRSARLAGPDATDEENNAQLISLMAGAPEGERRACYRCVAVALFPDGTEIVAEGACEGTIAMKARGTGGFGYDPWFIPAGETRAMAELSSQEKHAISHRGRALRDLAARLQGYLAGGSAGRPASTAPRRA